MPITVRKFNAQVKDPDTGQMVPAGLLSSDSLEAIDTAKTAAINAIQQKGVQTRESIPDDYTELSDSVDDLKTQINNVDELLKISDFPISGIGTHVGTSTSDFVTVFECTLKSNVLYKINCELEESTSKTVYIYLSKKSDNSSITTSAIAIGSTTVSFSVSVAEDTDARLEFTVGVDNVTLSATIDTQYNESKKNVVNEVENNTRGVNLEPMIVGGTWEKGGIDNATGETNNDGSNTRSRIIKYYQPGELVKVSNNTTNSVLWIIEYNKDGDEYVFAGSESVNGGSERSLADNSYYLRFDLRGGIQYTDAIVFQSNGIIKVSLDSLDERTKALEDAPIKNDAIGNANLIRESLPNYYFSAPTWLNATTAADMTDTTKAYLYLGSETGYTNGAVYTYNSDDSEWQTDETASYNVDEYLNQKIKDIPGTPNCIFFTDIHWRSQPDQHLPEIVQYLLAKIGRKPVIFGGDSVVAEANKYMGYKELRRFTDKMKDSFGEVYYPVIGDHDNNAVDADTPEELAIQEIPFVKCYEGAFGVMPDGITAISADTLDGITLTDAQYAETVAYLKMNYYFDDTEMQTRYIFITSGMEMGALKDAFGITNVGYQIYLVLNFLYDAVLNAPSGYNVVLTMHNLVEDDNTDPNDKQPAPPNAYQMMAIKMLYARKNKLNYVAGVGTVSNANLLAYFEPDSGKTYKTYHFDGADLPDIGKVVVLSGDVHYNASLITNGGTVATMGAEVIQPGTSIPENQILMISTQTASYGSITQSSLCYPMVQGTVTEQALDILSFTENSVNFTRIGAGYDRTFPYRNL